MADNVTIDGITYAADEISSVKYQRVKLTWGVDGTAVDASATNPLPISAPNNLPVALQNAIPAGSNTIGGVNIITSALPTGASTSALQTTGNTALGATTDAEATGNGSIIAVLKRMRTLLGGTITVDVPNPISAIITTLPTLPAGTNLIGKMRIVDAAGADINYTQPTAGTVTRVTCTTTSQQLKASNVNRKAIKFFNDSPNTVLVNEADVAVSDTVFSFKMEPGDFYVADVSGGVYVGAYRFKSPTTTGAVIVTELT